MILLIEWLFLDLSLLNTLRHKPWVQNSIQLQFTKVLSMIVLNLLTIVFIVLVMVRCTGGEAPGGSALAPKIGPLGLVNSPFAMTE
jgi:hypothetical protein